MQDKPPGPWQSSLRVIAPSLGRRYSGINASLIAVLPAQARRIPIAAMGFHLPDDIPRIGIAPFLLGCRSEPWRVWHARRNIEMVAGMLLTKVFGCRLLLLFTSAAQRRHTWITRFCLRHMDAVITASRAAASYLERESTIVHHGVDTEEFFPPRDRGECWRSRGLPGRFGIGIIGRIRPQKGTGDFVEAMVRVLPQRPDWTAVIVGQTTSEFRLFERELREKIARARLKDRVHFTGYLPDRAAIPDWYRSLSVVVCASRVEGFGLTCLEAMASGCPVVATRTGAWPELLVEGETGRLVPAADASALAQAILEVTEDPVRAGRIGARAREAVLQSHTIEAEADGIHQVYRDLLSKRGVAV